MLKSLIQPSKAKYWTVFHLLLGAVSTITPWALIAWFYLVFMASLNAAIVQLKKGRVEFYSLMLAYLLGFELLDRMSKSSPFIPYELGKYMLLVFGLLGLLLSKRKAAGIGLGMIVLILPGILYDESGQRNMFDIINNFFPPLALAFGVALWASHSMSSVNWMHITRLLWYSCVAALVFTFIKTPELDEIGFSLRANFDTSGGHASNQVSTILGFGMFLSFYAWFKKWRFSGYRVVDALFFAGFAFQGLLTFSRGGMVVGIMGILVVFGFSLFGTGKKGNLRFQQAVYYVAIGLLALALVFNSLNEVTGGKLFLRYSGETEGTAGGYAEKDLVKMTAGRSKIFTDDIALWFERPLIGVGAGASSYMRDKEFNSVVAPHNELSRLLADHGILGLLYFIFILIIGSRIWKNRSRLESSDLVLALFIIGLATSFHSAMRTYMTPFLIAVTSMYSQINKNINRIK